MAYCVGCPEIWHVKIRIKIVPLVEPTNSCYMVIFPKLMSVARVPLVDPIIAIIWSISQN